MKGGARTDLDGGGVVSLGPSGVDSGSLARRSIRRHERSRRSTTERRKQWKVTYQLRLGCFTLACGAKRVDSLPTVDDVIVSTRSKRLSIRSPRETTDLGSVSDELSDLVSGDSDVVVMD